MSWVVCRKLLMETGAGSCSWKAHVRETDESWEAHDCPTCQHEECFVSRRKVLLCTLLGSGEWGRSWDPAFCRALLKATFNVLLLVNSDLNSSGDKEHSPL